MSRSDKQADPKLILWAVLSEWQHDCRYQNLLLGGVMKFQPLSLIISKLINEYSKKGLQNIGARLGMIYYKTEARVFMMMLMMWTRVEYKI